MDVINLSLKTNKLSDSQLYFAYSSTKYFVTYLNTLYLVIKGISWPKHTVLNQMCYPNYRNLVTNTTQKREMEGDISLALSQLFSSLEKIIRVVCRHTHLPAASAWTQPETHKNTQVRGKFKLILFIFQNGAKCFMLIQKWSSFHCCKNSTRVTPLLVFTLFRVVIPQWRVRDRRRYAAGIGGLPPSWLASLL